MKISVAMATYNGAMYIEKQLESIRGQSVSPDEVIICDDNSTDDTYSIIENYIIRNHLQSWKLYRNKTNVGYKRNFYVALKEVKGDIVFLSDQDDEWLSNKIETIMGIFCSDNRVLAVNSAVTLIDEFSEPLFNKPQKNYVNSNFLYTEKKLSELTDFDELYISKHNITPGCAMAVKKSIIDEFLCLYDFGIPHDWFLNLIASYKKGCFFLDKELVRYRIHSQNAIGSNTDLKKGIMTKDKDFRIEDFNNRKNALFILNNKYNCYDTREIIKLYDNMISFYDSPSVLKLFKLYRCDGYMELSKRKVKFWEIILALHLEWLVKMIVIRLQ